MNTLADTSANDGKCSLREAIRSANLNAPSGAATGECAAGSPSGTDQIAFSVGGTITLTSDQQFISGDVNIDGGDVITVSGADQYLPFEIDFGNVGISQLVITHGHTAGDGGAIYNNGTLTLTAVTISSSSAPSGNGGGIYSLGSTFLISSRLTTNHAAAGGGFTNDGGQFSAIDSRIDGNTTDTVGGGGFTNDGGTTQIVSSRIDHNHASLTGGGLGSSGTVTIQVAESVIETNNATPGGYGGGMGSGDPNSTWTLEATTVRGNSSISGSAFSGQATSFIATGSTFSGNTASLAGGAFNTESGTFTLVNSTLAGNSSVNPGSAVYNNGATVLLTNSTVTANNSTNSTAISGAAGTVQLRNSLVAGNRTNGVAGTQYDGAVTLVVGNVVATSATGLLDPAGLVDNGGLTKTVKPLKTATSVIGKGDSAICASTEVGSVDQRGVTRPSGACDIGAVELESTAPTASAPVAMPAPGSAVSSTVPVFVNAGWSDPGGSGVKRFVLQKSINGGSWTTVTSTMRATGITLRLATGASYRFRVKPVDYDGNVGAYSRAGTAGTPVIRQQSAATFSGSWTTVTSTSYSGGSVRKSSTAGASVKYAFTGRAIAFVSTRAANRGKVKIYLDGVFQGTIDLYGATTKYKVIAWSRRVSSSSSHVLKLIVVGSPSRPRVDVDAFVVLK